MARPKSQHPLKQKLTLTVAPSVREQLALLAELKGLSISALVEQWTTQEIENINQLIKENTP